VTRRPLIKLLLANSYIYGEIHRFAKNIKATPEISLADAKFVVVMQNQLPCSKIDFGFAK
jgi:hypothetical protein